MVEEQEVDLSYLTLLFRCCLDLIEQLAEVVAVLDQIDCHSRLVMLMLFHLPFPLLAFVGHTV